MQSVTKKVGIIGGCLCRVNSSEGIGAALADRGIFAQLVPLPRLDLRDADLAVAEIYWQA